MSVPGFVAERSLYRTSHNFWVAGRHAPHISGVRPQAIAPDWGGTFCVDDPCIWGWNRTLNSWAPRQRQRCCYRIGDISPHLLGCKWIECAEGCWNHKVAWIDACCAEYPSLCEPANPYSGTFCFKQGNDHYNECLKTGRWSALPAKPW
jgi:hypothetical protein